MGLQISTPDPYGVGTHDAAYVKIVEVAWNYVLEKARCTMLVYTSKEAADAGKSELGSIAIGLEKEAQPDRFDPGTGKMISPAMPAFSTVIEATKVSKGDGRTELYQLSKAVPDLKNAVDVLEEGQVIEPILEP